MTDPIREQRPLLCEEYSDDEKHYYPDPQFASLKGRARNKIKGAAAIIATWPDHWSSPTLYVWVVFGMLLLTFIVIYSSLMSFALIPVHNPSARREVAVKDVSKAFEKRDVFMHILVQNNNEEDLKKYLPYLNDLTNTFKDFTYNLFILYNNSMPSKKTAKEFNEIALNSVMSTDRIDDKLVHKLKNINIRRMSLVNYMNDSPLNEKWRKIPSSFIPFLVRAISVWENGGIAFNPLIITPQAPNPIYHDKIHEILWKYNTFPKPHHQTSDVTSVKGNRIQNSKYKQKVNNIQDIIDALESEDSIYRNGPQNLSEVEDQLITKMIFNNTVTDQFQAEKRSTETTSENILRRYFFPNNVKLNKTIVTRAKLENYDTASDKDTNLHIRKKNMYKPMFVLPDRTFKDNFKMNSQNIISSSVDSIDQNLIIDIKGHIIATEIGCHALIESFFNNILHYHDSENITDFLVSELSLFCKGLVSSCKGIDIILI